MEYYHNDKAKIIDEIKAKGVDTGYNITMEEIPSKIAEITEVDLQEKEITITNNGTTTVEPDEEHNGLTSVIITTAVQGGREEAEEKDVNFYDFDGFRTNSYTKDEFLALTELPANPEHEGLTARGWSKTLEEAQTYVTNYGLDDLGQYYETSDGKTRIHITLNDGRTEPKLSVNITGTAIINWGDDSEEDELTGNNLENKTAVHNYANGGSYVITITPEEESQIGFVNGDSSRGAMILTSNGGTTYLDEYYRQSIRAIEFGKNIALKEYSLNNLTQLETITMPLDVDLKNTGAYKEVTFKSCRNAKCIVLPKGVTKISSFAPGTSTSDTDYTEKRIIMPEGVIAVDSAVFNYSSVINILLPHSVTTISGDICTSGLNIKNIVIPNKVTSLGYRAIYSTNARNVYLSNTLTTIGDTALAGNSQLVKIVVPASVTTITGNAFNVNRVAKCYDFSNATAVPTLSTGTGFTDMPNDCRIVVPDELYTEWTTAENWSNFASKIVKASEYTE